MEEIHINKEELLGILKKNSVTHDKIYKKSTVAFKKNYLKTVAKMLKDGKKNKFEMFLGLTRPSYHKQDYQDTIRMVELDERDILILDQMEFKRYVLNRWGWIGSFKSAYYTNISSSSSSSTSSSRSSSSKEDGDIVDYFKHSQEV